MQKEAATEVALVPVLEAQKVIRPLYDKGPAKPPEIGDHPDYSHLKDTAVVEFGPITTLFVDIQGSTRLGLLYDLETVFQVKNALIRLAVDVVSAFDGHVHRIMGDAVMAYFGRVGEAVERGAIDALNAASLLRLISLRSVAPVLEDMGLKPGEFGIRIGVDHGAARKVLWSSYGQRGMSEVTATSFFVDAAAKLQQQAGKNNVLIGNSLKDLLDFPDHLVDLRTMSRDGESRPDPYLRPNYSRRDGSKCNYKKHVLNTDEYLRCGPLGLAGFPQGGTPPVRVRVHEYSEREKTYLRGVTPSSDFLQKHRHLLFSFSMDERPSYPYEIRTQVENHGREAADEGQLEGKREKYAITNYIDEQNLRHWESTAFRGLHYLHVEVVKDGAVKGRSRVGIYIE